MPVRRRKLLGAICGGFSVPAAGCSRSSSSQTLRLGFVRVVNLEDTSVDARIVLSPADDGTTQQRSRTLQRINANGNSQADVLLYQPSDSPAVSAYEYRLYTNDKLATSVEGQQIKKRYRGRYTEASCVVLHFYINNWRNDISFSSELYEECNLPTK